MKKMLTMLLALAMMLSTACAMAEEITYVAYTWDEALQKLSSETKEVPAGYTEVEDSGSAVTWDSGWYVVKGGNVQIGGRITVRGKVHLLLCEGAKLTAGEGVSVRGGDELIIYGQRGGTGELIATATGEKETSGIGSARDSDSAVKITGGRVTIHGGTVTAAGSAGGTGIGGSSNASNSSGSVVTIYGGTVTATATGENGHGIYSENDLTIYGGTVNASATGTDGAGIYGEADLTIYGGTVNAEATGTYGVGMYSKEDVTISGGTVNVTRSSEYGIYSSAGHLTISGGTVDVTSAGHAISGDTILGTSGDVTISGGTVTLVSTGVDDNGILGRDVKISGKDTVVKATGCFAIGSSRDMNILNGTVVAQSNGKGSGKIAAGLFSHAGRLTISGGKVTAEANCEKGRGIYCENGGAEISGGDVRVMGRVKSIHAFAGLKVDDALHSMGGYDGTTDWTPAAPEHVGGYQWAWFAPGVPVSFKLGGGAKTVRVPAEGTWLTPRLEELGLTVPQGLAYTGVWMHNGAQYPIGARAPQISGGETFTMEISAAAAEDLPKTGDPSMLGAWALLLGASAMGLGKMKKKS